MKYDLRLIGFIILATAMLAGCNKKKNDVLVAEADTVTETTSSENTGRTKVIPSRNDAPPPPPPPPPAPSTEEAEVFIVVEEMPQFPGCELMKANRSVVKKCAENKMKTFLAKHVSYPEVARKEGVEGTAIVKFIVDKDGSIDDIILVRDPGSGIGKELVRVVSMMNEMESKWIPGRQRGRAVRVMFTLPFKFSL